MSTNSVVAAIFNRHRDDELHAELITFQVVADVVVFKLEADLDWTDKIRVAGINGRPAGQPGVGFPPGKENGRDTKNKTTRI